MGSIALCTFKTGTNKYELHEIRQTNDKNYRYNKRNYASLADLPANARCFALVRENEKNSYVAIIVGFLSELIFYNGRPADCVLNETKILSYASYEENSSSLTDTYAITCAVSLLNTNFKILK